jgi:8-oxo-dGTP diphosphatase
MAKKSKYVYQWPRPMVTVDAVVFRLVGDKIKVLLIQRSNEPYKGKWALPGGFVDIDEEIEDAATRELAEETGLTGVALEQMHTFGRCGRDPRGRQISVAFFGIAPANTKNIKGGDDAARAEWFDIRNLPEELAFDHNEIIKFGIKTLKRKSAYCSRRKV